MGRWTMGIAFSLLVATPALPQGTLLDQIVAVVRSEPMLLSELISEGRLLLLREGDRKAALGPLSPGLLMSLLDRSIAQRVLESEARRLQVGAVPPAQLDQALADLALAPVTLEALGLTAEEALRFVERAVTSEAFVEKNLRLAVFVSEDEIRQTLDAEGSGEPLEEARRRIRESLETRKVKEQRGKYNDHLRSWFASLKARGEIRIFVDEGSLEAVPSCCGGGG